MRKYKLCRILSNVLIICIGFFYFGYTLIYISTIPTEQIINKFQIHIQRSIAQGIFAATLSIGSCIGSLLSRYVISKFSRRNSLIVTELFGITGGILIQITNISPFIIGRFLQGISIGLFGSISPIYIKQITPIEIYGSVGSLSQIFIGLGAITINILSIFVDSTQLEITPLWRYIFGVSLILLIFQMICLLFLYSNQTPKYLLQNDRYLEARQLVNELYQEGEVEEVLQILQNDVRTNLEYEMQQQTNSIPIWYSYYIWMFVGFSGVSVIAQYGTRIIKTLLPISGGLIQGFLNIIQLSANIVSMFWLMRKFQKKIVFQIGIVILIISLINLATSFLPTFKQNGQITYINKISIVVGLNMFMLGYGATIGVIIWQYVPEIVQPKIVSNARLLNGLSSTTSVLLYPILASRIGESAIFYFMSMLGVLTLYVNQRYMIETKGKTESEIKDQYDQLAENSV